MREQTSFNYNKGYSTAVILASVLKNNVVCWIYRIENELISLATSCILLTETTGAKRNLYSGRNIICFSSQFLIPNFSHPHKYSQIFVLGKPKYTLTQRVKLLFSDFNIIPKYEDNQVSEQSPPETSSILFLFLDL